MVVNVPKERFQTLLSAIAGRTGLAPAAVDQLVRGAQLGHWTKGQAIFAAEDTGDFVHFLVAGVVRVSCPSGSGTVCVQLVRPGQFFGLNWYAGHGQTRLFSANAFTDATVAIITTELMAKLVGNSRPPGVLQILAYSWRVLSRLLYEKCSLLGLDLEERLIHELAVLARDFGREESTGILIDLPLTHADLAELALGSRSNVARVMKRFERADMVARSGRKIVLRRRFVDVRENPKARVVLRDLLPELRRSFG
jgi:CRP/FNR family transcriptional regulator